MNNSKWISIKNELPRQDDSVIVAIVELSGNRNRSISIGCYEGDDWYIELDDFRLPEAVGYRVTHWQHWPELPTLD